MKDLIVLTRAFSEFNSNTDIGIEESPKFIGDWCCMNLKRMWYIIKNFPSRMNGVCDNYNFSDALKIGSLIYATSYSEQFSFSSCDINHMMNHFDDLFVINMDMRDGDSNLILYASIGYHQSNWGIWWGSESNII